MAVDSSELDSLIHDLSRAGPVLAPKVRGIVSKGALNVKNRMQADAKGSQHFGQLAHTIDYDLNVTADGVSADIGPNKERGGSASLAGIAYFGTSRPGGATVPDPVLALEEEAPRFVQNLAEAAGFVFG